MKLKEMFKNSKTQYVTEIADIQDEEKMMSIMRLYNPDVVYHAAAHKHVPLMEHNPEEAIKNNVIGTMNVARAAHRHNVRTFVMVSTDKAVNPTSVMGATKKLAEMVIQSMDKNSETKFVTVRFGNVLGSKGSVVPLFKKQIEQGRSEEHTSELQSRGHLVCSLLLEKKNTNKKEMAALTTGGP